MRRAKRIALWTLGVLLLSILGAVIFLAAAGDDFYRWAMQRAIEGRIDREIRVDGSFSFDVGLEPALIVTDVSIENAPWADKKHLARAGRGRGPDRTPAAVLGHHPYSPAGRGESRP